MRLLRIRLSIRGILIGIAVSTVLTYYVVAPAWKYYRLDPLTRQALRQLRTPMTLTITRAQPVLLEDFFKQIQIVSQNQNNKALPIYTDPMGLQEADKSLAVAIEATTSRMPIQDRLKRALPPLGLDFFVKDGLITVTSAKTAREVLQANPQDATHP